MSETTHDKEALAVGTRAGADGRTHPPARCNGRGRLTSPWIAYAFAFWVGRGGTSSYMSALGGLGAVALLWLARAVWFRKHDACDVCGVHHDRTMTRRASWTQSLLELVVVCGLGFAAFSASTLVPGVVEIPAGEPAPELPPLKSE